MHALMLVSINLYTKLEMFNFRLELQNLTRSTAIAEDCTTHYVS